MYYFNAEIKSVRDGIKSEVCIGLRVQVANKKNNTKQEMTTTLWGFEHYAVKTQKLSAL